MQAVGFTEQISLVVPLFEAVMPQDEGFLGASYPYPSLRAIGRSESRDFEAITLENDFLKVQWVAELGGRMVSCLDKRTGRELIPPAKTVPQLRGDGISLGIAVLNADGSRLNDSGPVDVAQIESDSSAAFVMAETAAGSDLSWHLFIRLSDDTAAIEYELRVVNRSLADVMSLPKLRIPPGFAIDERWVCRDDVAASRIHPPEIGPLGTATMSAILIPLAPGAVSRRASQKVAVTMDQDGWTLYPSERSDVVILIGARGQTFEARLILDPSTPTHFPLAELPEGADQIAIRGLDTKFLLEPASEAELPDWSPPRSWPEDADPSDWINDPLLGGVAAVRLADRHMASEEWDECSVALDRATALLSENPLVWWRRAALGRLTHRGDEADLPNAHYLAPIEPLLRAEAFLNQSPEMTSDPSPLVAPFASRPEQMVEVAVRWLEIGRYDQATRWIDEALRHKATPMLYYLQAYAFLAGKRMEVEIPNLLSRAAKLGIQPPYPYRNFERRAIEQLSENFPQDIQLAKYRHLMA